MSLALPQRRLLTIALTAGCVAFSASRAEAVAFPVNTILATNAFHESLCLGGDAGNTFPAACPVLDSLLAPYDGFAGDIGFDFPTFGPSAQADDFFDIFAFNWLTTEDFIAVANTTIVGIDLFTHPGAAVVPGDTNPDQYGITIANLPAGNYYLMVTALVDPPFTISVLDPQGGPFLNIGPLQVPEPGVWLLLGAAAAVGGVRRRLRGRPRE
jgi:hypothetical protein